MEEIKALSSIPAEPLPNIVWVVDLLALALPAVAAILAIISGVAALEHQDQTAAICGIVSGIISAIGVVVTGQAAKLQTQQLRHTLALANLGVEMANTAITQPAHY